MGSIADITCHTPTYYSYNLLNCVLHPQTIQRNIKIQSPKIPLFGNNSLDCPTAHPDSPRAHFKYFVLQPLDLPNQHPTPCPNIYGDNPNPVSLSTKLSILDHEIYISLSRNFIKIHEQSPFHLLYHSLACIIGSEVRI
jgi:hypothetical protein